MGKLYKFILMDEQTIYFRQNILDLLKLTNFRKLAAISLFRIKIDQIFAYTCMSFISPNDHQHLTVSNMKRSDL